MLYRSTRCSSLQPRQIIEKNKSFSDYCSATLWRTRRRSITDQYIKKLCSSSCETPSIITRAAYRPQKNLLANTPNAAATRKSEFRTSIIRAHSQHGPLRDIDKPSLIVMTIKNKIKTLFGTCE
uniref:Uncharacterized protein n=1 Tax=Schizaphis graminum TaxID=13262 RepID=A0A2S2NQ98_SCHGA